MINHKSSANFDIPSDGVFGPEITISGAVIALQSRPPMNEFQELVRDRIRSRVDNASTLARFLKEHPSTITKRLQRGGPALCLDFLDRLREFFGGWTPSEMCAEPGATITSITAIESSMLAHFRQMTELERRSLLTILERPIFTQAPHAKKSRLGRAMLTVKEQELVDLYARVKKDGVREGVLKTLRGAAEADDVRVPVKPRTTG
jgi:hypothetical protein